MMRTTMRTTWSLAAATLLSTAVNAQPVRVTVTNTAPTGGTYLTPVWIGFHDGAFDLFDAGSGASAALERVAEDGNTAPLSSAFAGSGIDATIGSAPIAPGASVSTVFDLDTDGSHDYFTFASMVLPSSDFFIGNPSPLANAIGALFDGSASAVTFTIGAVWDAGTEINDFAFSAGNPLLGFAGGQSGPDQGALQNGVVSAASGSDYLAFLNVAGNDVGPLNFDDFASLATIEVAAVPVPAALPLLASALGMLAVGRRVRPA